MDSPQTGSPKIKKMLGIGFEVEEMMKLFLIIIIGLVVVVLIIGASGGLQSLLAEFCAKNPGICGDVTSSKDDAIVEKSTDALICAINSVTANKDAGCLNSFKSIKTAGITGFALGQDSKDAYIECKFREETIPVIKPDDPWYKRAYYRVKYLFSSPPKEEYGCTVYNFNLPQKVTTAEKWIAGYGDPQYIVYWQNFPHGEESAWTGYSTWLKNAGTVILFALPVEKILQGGSWLVKKTATSVAEKTTTKITAKGAELVDEFKSRFLKAGEEPVTAIFNSKGYSSDILVDQYGKPLFIPAVTKEVEKEALEGYYSKYILNQYGQPAFIESTTGFASLTPEKKLALFKKLGFGGADIGGTAWSDIETMMQVAKVTTPPALMAAFIDSVNEKYEKKPGSVVIKKPYVTTKEKALDNKRYSVADPLSPEKVTEVGYVVILDKNLNVLQDPKSILRPAYAQFYLASPCRADLKIKESTVFCEKYNYDKTTGVVDCVFTDRKTVCEESTKRFPGYVDPSNCNSETNYFNYVPQCGPEELALNFVSGSVSGTSSNWCRSYAIQVSADKSKYKEDANFCFTQPSKYTGVIFLGAIAGDIFLKYIGVGWLPQVTFGIIAGTSYVVAEQYEKWP